MNPKKCTIGTESLEGKRGRKVWPSDSPFFVFVVLLVFQE